jgi:hypothetical protein
MSAEDAGAYHRAYQKTRRESGWTTVNVPPDVREGLQEVKRALRVNTGIMSTDADVLRFLINFYRRQES